MRSSYLFCASVIAITAAMLPAAALAQQAPAAANDATEVGEIIVTAQRRSESLQRVPVSVTAVTAETLTSRNINDLNQVAIAAPSLQIGTTGAFSIRGVGTLALASSVDSSVAIAIDEVNLGRPNLSINLFNDVARVEVLNGPQGLLFGRNASAGLLNIVTRRPEMNDFSGRVYAEQDYRDTLPGGKWGTIVRGTVNIPLAPIAALRLNAIYSDQDPIGTVTRSTPSADVAEYQRRAGGKAKLLIEPTPDLSLYFIADYSSQTGVGGIYDRTYRSFGPGSLTGIFAGLDGVKAGPKNFEYGASAPANQKLRGGGVSSNITYHLSDSLSISNVTAYRSYRVANGADLDFTSFDGVDNNNRSGRYDQFSNELRVTYSGNTFIDGQAGLYYFASRIHEIDSVSAGAFGAAGPFDSFNNPLFGLDINSKVKGDSYAAFGQFNIHPTDKLTLIAGGRFTRDEISIDLIQNLKPYPIPLGVPNYATKQSAENDDFSWKFGAQYEITPDVMVYATHSKGYKGPAFNDTVSSVGQQLAIGPETVHNTEIGIKSVLLDRRLRLNVTAFNQEFKDFQVQGFDPNTTTYFTNNAASVTSRGVEIFAEARPVGGLTLTAAVTVLDSKFGSYKNDKCYPSQPVCNPDGTTDSSGNRTPSSARFTSSLGANYEHPITDDVTLIVAGDWYHRSSLNFTSNGNPLTELGAIDVFGFSVGAKFKDNLRITAFCKNCTDEVFPVFIGGEALDGTLLGVNSTANTWGYNSVRTLGVSLSYDF
jgi:iron complex outermembrane receptor protein